MKRCKVHWHAEVHLQLYINANNSMPKHVSINLYLGTIMYIIITILDVQSTSNMIPPPLENHGYIKTGETVMPEWDSEANI